MTILSSLRLLPLLACCLCAGCGSSQPNMYPAPTPSEDPAKVTWNMLPQGLRYYLEAGPALNMDKEHPLGLTVCVYQLADSNKFQALAASAEGLDQLLDCRMETAGAQSARQYQLQPADKRSITADRAEGARMLAVVAGYAHENPNLSTAIFPYPVEKGSKGFFRTTVYSAAPLEAIIRFTDSAVSITGVRRAQ